MGAYYELALTTVLVAGSYFGIQYVRNAQLRASGIMQLAAAALAGLGLVGRKYDDFALGIAGAIGLGVGACVLVLGPFVRGLARRAAAAERFTLAQRLLDVTQVLVPGSGVAEEKAMVGAMSELRSGNIERTVDALNAAKGRASADRRFALDEQIALLYLAAYRWDDAIAHAEAHLFDLPAPDVSAQAPLRRVLGIAPHVWVELIGAYGYTGDLERAAQMLGRLEEACAGRDDGALWLHRGRMMFLSLAGRVNAVQQLVEPRRSRHMSAAARTYWLAVAHERHGDNAAAGAAYARARSRSRGRPRALIDQALARLEGRDLRPNGSAAEGRRGSITGVRPIELGAEAQGMLARVETAAPPEVAAPPRARGPIATHILIGALVATSVAIAIAFGESTDLGVLVRSGAMLRELVRDGEWWRLVSCIFVHVGGMHLLVNALGLLFLGRIAEALFGSWRTLAIFAVAGLAGAVASFFGSPAGLSAGASGAIFGLLGALLVELTWQRSHHRVAWTRGVGMILAAVTVAQIGNDFVSSITDQWAHAGGLLAGALLGFVLSPHARWQRPARHVARVVAVAFAALAVVAGVFVARTSLADSLARTPARTFQLRDVSVSAPSSWEAHDTTLSDSAGLVQLDVMRVNDAPEAAVTAWLAGDRELQNEHTAPAPRAVIAMPAGWTSKEVIRTEDDTLDNPQHVRFVVAARAATAGTILVRLAMPDTYARDAAPFFTRLLGSLADH